MALIAKLKKIEKERNNIHNKVQATYTTFKDNFGIKYFQIDTYGSEERKIKGKVSQSLQFDEKAIFELINLFKKEFEI